MGAPKYIKLSKYLTHSAVWQTTGVGTYGDTIVSTSQTVSCFYFTGSIYREVGRANVGQSAVENVALEHSLLLYSTPNVKVGDTFVNITDQDGAITVALARAVKVEAYRYYASGMGNVLQQITLEFN